MPTLETTRLQLAAGIAQDQANRVAAQAAEAEKREQLRALEAQGALRAGVSGAGYFVAALVVAFVAWAYVTEPPAASYAAPAPPTFSGPPPVPKSTEDALRR